jgi:hypothetical protein
VWLQQIVIIAGDCVNRNGTEMVVVVVSGCKVGVMKQGVRVAGGTADIVCFVMWLQEIVLKAGDCVTRTEWEGLELWLVGLHRGRG